MDSDDENARTRASDEEEDDGDHGGLVHMEVLEEHEEREQQQEGEEERGEGGEGEDDEVVIGFPDALREIALILFHRRHRQQTHEGLMGELFRGNSEREEDARLRVAMEATPRSMFVPAEACSLANDDMPLDLHAYGLNTNLSAPHIYPRVLQLLRLDQPGLSVLDVGCGTGLLSTICWRLGARVEGWDIDECVIAFARQVAARREFGVRYRLFNAFWPLLDESCEAFDRVHLGASISHAQVPHFMRLLKVGGLMVAPVESGLFQITKIDHLGNRRSICDTAVRFRTLVEPRPVEGAGQWEGWNKMPPHVRDQLATVTMIWALRPESPLSAMPRELLFHMFAYVHPFRAE